MKQYLFLTKKLNIRLWLCDGWLSCVLLHASLLPLPLLSAAERSCPASCRCEGKMAYCESASLDRVPEGLSPGCQGLSLRYNPLRSLLPQQFAHLGQLAWLYLDHSGVGTVDAHAFQGLRRLKELVLSSNGIAHLENATFASAPNLRNLDLSYNRLGALLPGYFQGLRKLQSLHLRSNSLSSISLRTFLECRSLEFLDLGYNRLRSLSRTTFIGLLRLTELHLEHNQFSRINFFLFPRLLSLQALFLQWNRIRAVVQGEPWTWYTLQRLDLSGNEIQTLDPDVFRCLPNLEVLNLESNKLSDVSQEVTSAWTSVTAVGLAGNAWDCSSSICPLVAWMRNYRGARDMAIICSSPRALQGERVMEAVRNSSICEEAVTDLPSSPPAPPTTPVPVRSTQASPSPSPTPTLSPSTTPPPAPPAPLPIWPNQKPAQPPSLLLPTTPPFVPEADLEHMSFHKIVAGGVALFLSLALILLVIYVSWRRYPGSMRQLQQPSLRRKPRRRRKHTRTQPEPPLAAPLQEYYLSYTPASTDTLHALVNGACTCPPSSGSRECEV
ncbi:hypothetical protein ACEWY4_011595 [Coilia grayii]|uniref:Leucine rich repeat transmembrane neuronal 4 n=1 Tax=Coilia grayii TaxID=363190 RepID=A0ABD1JY43_9TELE